MANQIIVTIGREYGSGGHDIAREIALCSMTEAY